MRINKSSESSSFDEYLKIISSFNKKHSSLKKIAMAQTFIRKFASLGMIDDILETVIGVGRHSARLGEAGSVAAKLTKSTRPTLDDFIRILDDIDSSIDTVALPKLKAKFGDNGQFIVDTFFGGDDGAKALLRTASRDRLWQNPKGGSPGDMSKLFPNAVPEAADDLERIRRYLYDDLVKRADDLDSVPIFKEGSELQRVWKNLMDEKALVGTGQRATPEQIQQLIDNPTYVYKDGRVLDVPRTPRGTPEPETPPGGRAPEPETPPGTPPRPPVDPANLDDAVRAALDGRLEPLERMVAELSENLDEYKKANDAIIQGMKEGSNEAAEKATKALEGQADLLQDLGRRIGELEEAGTDPALVNRLKKLAEDQAKTADEHAKMMAAMQADIAKAGRGGRLTREAAKGVSSAITRTLVITGLVLGGVWATSAYLGDEIVDGIGGMLPGGGGTYPETPTTGGRPGPVPGSRRPGGEYGEGEEFVAIREAANSNNAEELNRLINAASNSTAKMRFITRNIFDRERAIKLPGEWEGMQWAFVTDARGGIRMSRYNDYELGSFILEGLNSPNKGGWRYIRELEPKGGVPTTAQDALNAAASQILNDRLIGLGGGARSRREYIRDTPIGFRGPRRRMMRRYRRDARRAEDENLNPLTGKEALTKESSLKIKEFYQLSTNNDNKNDVSMHKSADEVSKSYHKDAVKDLREKDKTLRDYYAGLGRLYDEESEKRKPDQKELYELHDETGRDLTLSAHPKAIRLSDAMGDGGLVENGLEQKNKMEGVALRTPTGNFESRYANLRDLLQKASK